MFNKAKSYFGWSRVLQKHWQPEFFSIYSTLKHRLHVAITLVLFRWLVVSSNWVIEMSLSYWMMLIFYFCYVIKTLITSSSNAQTKIWQLYPGERELDCPYYEFISSYFIFGENPADIRPLLQQKRAFLTVRQADEGKVQKQLGACLGPIYISYSPHLSFDWYCI